MDDNYQDSQRVYTNTSHFVKKETEESTIYKTEFVDSEYATNLIKKDVQDEVHYPKGTQDMKVETIVEEEIICPYCLMVVTDSDQALQCDGVCDKWYHIHCVEVGIDEYHALGAMDTPWVCPYCPNDNVRVKSEEVLIKDEPHDDDIPSFSLIKHDDDEDYNPSSCDDFDISSSEGETNDSDEGKSQIVMTTLPVNIRSVSSKSKKRCFKCYACDSSYTKLQFLNRHYSSVHLGEKPFRCKICKYATSNNNHLRVHMMRHKDQRPFQCKECNFRFHRRTDLNVHSRIHTGEKPYNCGQCDFSSSRRGNLVYHLRQHSGKKIKCSKCDYIASSKYDWRVHFKEEHKDFK